MDFGLSGTCTTGLAENTTVGKNTLSLYYWLFNDVFSISDYTICDGKKTDLPGVTDQTTKTLTMAGVPFKV
jgi:hypothetical protein